MSLSDLASITISPESSAVTREGFGVPLIVGASNRFSERFRAYTSLASLEDDGFVAADAEHRAVTRLLSSNVKPPLFLVGNAANRPTMRWKVTPLVATAGAKYELKVGNPASTATAVASFTADASPTVAEITLGLKGAVDALAFAGITTTDASTHLTITATTPGAYVSLVTLNRELLAIEMDHADPGIAADLSAMLEAALATEGAADFYAICLCFPSTATLVAAAAWTEANKRLLLAATSNTDVTRAVTTDVASTLRTAAYARTAVYWHHDSSQFIDAGIGGRCLPLTPGSETWQTKTVAGLDPSPLKPSEVVNLKGKSVNYYQRIKGRNVTLGGAKVAAGEFIDTVRGIDELTARLGEDVFSHVADRDEKDNYDDGGIVVMKGIVENRLRLSVGRLLAADPAPVVSAPSAAEVDPALKAVRTLPISFRAVKAGAIHQLVITGRLA